MEIMEMYFYSGTSVHYVFPGLDVNGNKGAYFGCLLLSYVLAIFVEFLSSKQLKSPGAASILYAVKLWFSYFLMLVLMTFNAGLFISVISGYVTGYFLFGFAPVTF